MKEQCGNLDSQLLAFIKEHTLIQYIELRAFGLSSSQIKKLQDKAILHKVSRGLYSIIDQTVDPFLELQLKYKKIIFSDETAASLHDMTDVTPNKYSVTVPRAYNYQYLQQSCNLKVRRLKQDTYELGVEEFLSPYGNIIRVYNRERTLCDLVKRKAYVESRIIIESLKSYMMSSTLDVNKLLTYAKQFRVEKEIRKYLEILSG